LTLVLLLNLGLVAGLVAVGLTARSLAVLAAGGDYLLDAAGVAVALIAIRLSARSSGRPPGRRAPTDLAALFNCGWLLVLELLVIIAAAERLVTGAPEVHGLPVLVVSGVAALTMTIGALVLRGGADDDDDESDGGDLSVAAVLLDTIADAAAAVGVAATGAIILATGGWHWLDPAVALVIAVVIGYHAIALLRKVLRRLRLRSGHRERRLPPPGGRLEFDPVDPLHPPVPAPAGCDQAQRVAVARGQGSAAHAGGQQQPADVAHRQADPVAGDGVHEQAPGSPGAAQQGADRYSGPVLLGVPAGGAVQGGP
jgi:cobalt-zinc-cadmium efflux system protein